MGEYQNNEKTRQFTRHFFCWKINQNSNFKLILYTILKNKTYIEVEEDVPFFRLKVNHSKTPSDLESTISKKWFGSKNRKPAVEKIWLGIWKDPLNTFK